MSDKEKIEHEAVKNAIKMCVMSNRRLTALQKQQAIDNIDRASRQADWFIELLRNCGYIV